MFSRDATGKCSEFRFLETGRPGGIFQLYKNKETCTGSESKNKVSKHEVHEPSTHDEDLSFLSKEVGHCSRLLHIFNGSIKDKCADIEKCSCLRQWKQPFILDRIVWRTWQSTRTRTSRKVRNWYWNILKRLWKCKRLKVHLFHGLDQCCHITIKWSSGQKQRHVSIQLPFYAWQTWMKAKMQLQDGKVKW